MPQGGFDDFDGADIANLDPVVMAEPLPTWSGHLVAILVREDARLPRTGVASRGLERDHARIPKSNRLSQGQWQRLQELQPY